MSRIRKLVLDVLKPHQPSILDLARALADIDGVDGVNVLLVEIDRKVESVKVTLEGSDIVIEDVERVINENGATIHSVDNVIAGKRLIKAGDMEGE